MKMFMYVELESITRSSGLSTRSAMKMIRKPTSTHS